MSRMSSDDNSLGSASRLGRTTRFRKVAILASDATTRRTLSSGTEPCQRSE